MPYERLKKIRLGFVTNSSSSSFIIGKKDDTNVTVESAYQIIKRFYKEYFEQRNNLIQYISIHPELMIEYKEENGYRHFVFKGSFEEEMKVHDMLENKFEISIWDRFAEDCPWLECETYSDYGTYWQEKRSADPNAYAPFTISDFLTEKSIDWLHERFADYIDNDTQENNILKINSESDVLNWYFEYAYEAFRHLQSCEGCKCSDLCSKKNCKRLKRMR